MRINIVKKLKPSLNHVKDAWLGDNKKKKDRLKNLSLPLISSLTKSKIYEKKSTVQR